jgi:hypothetical protein
MASAVFNTLTTMTHLPGAHHGPHHLVACYRSADAMRSRSIGGVVLTGVVDILAPSAGLLADWERETTQRLGLEPGDVESLSLPRARVRWPDYRRCVQAVSDWSSTVGLHGVLCASDVALMACRGARYHHDAQQYGGAVFCNLFVSEDKGLDLHFPSAGRRIPLVRGTVVVFDTGQPHAAIDRRHGGFDVADFPPDRDCSQVFLTWELAVESADVARALGVDFDIVPSGVLPLDEGQVWLNGAPAHVCPASGRWLVGG